MAMTMHERGKVLRRALVVYSTANQVSKAIEEMGELITAIARSNQDPRSEALRSQVIEEIADVKIMVDQLALIFGALEVQEKEAEKLDRLVKRMGAE